MKSLNTGLRNLQRRLGAREELIAVIVLGLLAASGLAFTLITNQGTPAGAALAYMAAIDRADSDYVWSHSIVNSGTASRTDVALMSRSALIAQLASTTHTRSGFAVQDVSFVSAGIRVTLTYKTSEGRKTTSLVLRGESPHSWPVVVEPARLDFKIPSGAGAFAIDGQVVPVTPGNEVTVAVFPGTHKVTLAASHLYVPYAGKVDGMSLPDLTSVSFSKVQLTGAGTTEAGQAVSQVFKSCAASTVLIPVGCPQSLRQDGATGAASWTLLGDPIAGSSVGLNDESTLAVSGHFLMQLSYENETTHLSRILAVGGPYLSALAWDGKTLKAAGFLVASAVADVPRPAVADAKVLAALKAQFDSCLTLQAGAGAGCLQIVLAFYASNFTWHEDTDPLQGASIGWDGTRAIFTVSGTYALSVDYDSTPPYSPTRRIHDTSSGQYIADLYWDGSKVVFIGLEK